MTDSQVAWEFGLMWADHEGRAQEIGNKQTHNFGVSIIGMADRRKGLRLCIQEVQLDLRCLLMKIVHDCAGGYDVHKPPLPDDVMLKTLKKRRVTLNQPIVFPAVYRAQGHLLNGRETYGVLLTAFKGRIFTPPPSTHPVFGNIQNSSDVMWNILNNKNYDH